jgi:hypothetical protein
MVPFRQFCWLLAKSNETWPERIILLLFCLVVSLRAGPLLNFMYGILLLLFCLAVSLRAGPLSNFTYGNVQAILLTGRQLHRYSKMMGWELIVLFIFSSFEHAFAGCGEKTKCEE